MSLVLHKWGDESLPAIFCIHGWASNAQVFKPLAELFQQHFHFVAVDLPGFGESEYNEGDYQLENIVAQLLEAAPAKSTWLGWSLGGMLAVQAALDSPARVDSVMTICSNAKFVASKKFKQGVPQPLFDGFMESIGDVRVTLRRFAALTVVGEKKDMLQSLKWLQQHTQAPAPTSQTLKASLELLALIDNQVALASLTQPCLHMLATDDAIVPHKASQVLNKINEKHLTSFVPNASHACLVTQPQLVANGILTFMQGLQNA